MMNTSSLFRKRCLVLDRMIPPSFDYLFFPFSLIFTECGKAFGLKKNLTDHMKVHTGGRRFMCDTCGQDFSWPNALKVYKLFLIFYTIQNNLKKTLIRIIYFFDIAGTY